MTNYLKSGYRIGTEATLAQQRNIDPTEIKHLVIAGWTGRNVEALEKHIRELEALGVKRPKSTPIFYRVAASLLTTGSSIEVLGEHSSGEQHRRSPSEGWRRAPPVRP